MSNFCTAVIVNDKKILMFHRDNIPTIADPDYWQLPGGYIEEREDPFTGIKRELLEEVSYIPSNLSPLGKRSNNRDSQTYIFIAYVNLEESQQFRLGATEGQEIGFFTISQIMNLKITPFLHSYLAKFASVLENAFDKEQKPPSDDLGLERLII